MAETPPLSLRIDETEEVAEDIHRFVLVDPAGAELPPFAPGAHIGVQVPSGVWRKYSLCNGPAERRCYVITVQREAGGRGGSASLVEQGRPGMVLSVAPPENAFALVPGAAGYLFVAGGIGITPILSMLRSLGSEAPWTLHYLTRSPGRTAYREELARHGPRVQLHHDQGDPSRQFDLWPLFEKPGREHIYCCGPRGLMDAVRDMTGHWPRSQLHFESFVDGSAVRADDRPFTVRLARSGTVCDVPVGQSILAVLRAAGHRLPSSCESGSCGTCRTGLLAGEADHRDMVLWPEEWAHQIMPCVSRAKSGELVLDL